MNKKYIIFLVLPLIVCNSCLLVGMEQLKLENQINLHRLQANLDQASSCYQLLKKINHDELLDIQRHQKLLEQQKELCTRYELLSSLSRSLSMMSIPVNIEFQKNIHKELEITRNWLQLLVQMVQASQTLSEQRQQFLKTQEQLLFSTATPVHVSASSSSHSSTVAVPCPALLSTIPENSPATNVSSNSHLTTSAMMTSDQTHGKKRTGIYSEQDGKKRKIETDAALFRSDSVASLPALLADDSDTASQTSGRSIDSSPDEFSKSTKITYECVYCSTNFDIRKNWSQHYNENMSHYPLKCYLCKIKKKRMHEFAACALKNHYMLVHSDLALSLGYSSDYVADTKNRFTIAEQLCEKYSYFYCVACRGYFLAKNFIEHRNDGHKNLKGTATLKDLMHHTFSSDFADKKKEKTASGSSVTPVAIFDQTPQQVVEMVCESCIIDSSDSNESSLHVVAAPINQDRALAESLDTNSFLAESLR